jgi:GTP-binding protein YchF
MLQAGIVGLPNVGKSTLFNALTRTRKAEAQNYPFCTIDPNVGVVQVPDHRLEPLAKMENSQKIVPAAIEMVDIAGLVAGASKGEGLGNQFLANIREVDAIVHVVRCFEDEDIIHNMGSVDPVRDIEIIHTELMLSDMDSIARQIDRTAKKARGNDKEAQANLSLLERVSAHLDAGKPVWTLTEDDEEIKRLKSFNLLTSKPVLFACNVAETDLATAWDLPWVKAVQEAAAKEHAAQVCVISASTESELIDFSPEEAKDYLQELGVSDSGVSELIRATYKLLDLASYLTAGPMETRAWTFERGMKAPQCAGVIHTDFEKGFIKAEVVAYDDLMAAGSVAAAREAGKYRMEGKEYVMKDGDVVHFRFNA